MSNRYLDILTQVVRHPRHAVGDATQVLIELERVQPSPRGDAGPEVLDFSRGGCRLQWETELRRNEPVVLRVTDVTNGLALEIPGVVRWSKPIEHGRHEAGCQFDDLVDYEHLGELFLAGFLSSEEAIA